MIVRRSGIGLRLTCKQIKEEATAILYGANTFLFTKTMHPVRANSALEFPENKRLLDRLLWYGGMNDMLQMRDFFQTNRSIESCQDSTPQARDRHTCCVLGICPFPYQLQRILRVLCHKFIGHAIIQIGSSHRAKIRHPSNLSERANGNKCLYSSFSSLLQEDPSTKACKETCELQL